MSFNKLIASSNSPISYEICESVPKDIKQSYFLHNSAIFLQFGFEPFLDPFKDELFISRATFDSLQSPHSEEEIEDFLDEPLYLFFDFLSY